MSGPRLGWLAWLGRRFGGRGPWHRIRWAGLVLGSTVVTAGMLAAAFWWHFDDLRQARADTLRPVIAHDRASASLLYSYDGFVSLADRQVLVISIWPLRPDAPQPPGMAVGRGRAKRCCPRPP